jgi:hypothetical protein
MHSLALFILELQTARRRLITIFEEPDGTCKPSASLSYGMTPRHIRYPTNREGIQNHMQYMVLQKVQDDGSYQPPRSPGFNEYLGG